MRTLEFENRLIKALNWSRKIMMIIFLIVSVTQTYAQCTGDFPYFETLSTGAKPLSISLATVNGTNAATFTTNGLQLTPATNSQFGAVFVNNKQFTSANGIHIEFEFSEYSSTGADGICLFLFDASIASPMIGANGAGLGYGYNRANNDWASLRHAGLTGAYLGVGLDAYGNFKGVRWQGDARTNGVITTSLIPHPSSEVTLRGAKGAVINAGIGLDDGYTGYPVLITQSTKSGTNCGAVVDPGTGNYSILGALADNFDLHTNTLGLTPASADYRKAFIDLIPNPSGGFNVTVAIQHGSTVATVINNYWYRTSYVYRENANPAITDYNTSTTQGANTYHTLNTAPPSAFRIGFGASTGGYNQINLIKNLTVTLPYAAVATSDAISTCANSNGTVFALANDIAYKGPFTGPPVAASSNVDKTSFQFVDAAGVVQSSPYNVSGVGTWSYNSATGEVTFAPALNYTGTSSVQYTINGTDAPFNDECYRSLPATITVTVNPTVTGTVFNDPDGGNVNNSSGTTNAILSGIYANLINTTTGLVVASVPVATDGTYSICGAVSGSSYYVSLTKTQSTVGVAAPAPSLPSFWMNTGEYIGAENTGTDGTIDGKSATFTVSSASQSNVNFGVLAICNNGTVSSLSTSGEIRSFIDPANSGNLGTVINSTPYGTTTNANALGYSPVTGKFYYFQVCEGDEATKVFLSYDPATNAYEKLSTTGTSNYNIYRGAVTNDGKGYYALSAGGKLLYYNIANNTWTTIVADYTHYIDQYGKSLQTILSTFTGGDLAIDGEGNMWILAGTAGKLTCYVFKLQGPLPTTTVTGMLTLTQIATQDIGASPNGIGFDSTGQLYITNGSTTVNNGYLFRINNDYTITKVGELSTPTGDLVSCAFPPSPLSAMDFGDAPDTYQTLQASNGARHLPAQFDAVNYTSPLMLGSKVDIEIAGHPSTNADGDDLNNINDEDGVPVFPPLYTTSISYSLSVKVTNTTGKTATIKGWIDFNRNGVFDASEGTTATVANGATTATLTWTGLSGLTAGKLYSRIRIATNATEIVNPTGLANDGEVEDDYKVSVGYTKCLISNKNVTNLLK